MSKSMSMEQKFLLLGNRHQVSREILSSLPSLTGPADLAQEHNDDPNLEGPSSAYTSDNISPESRFLQGTSKHKKKRKDSSSGFDEAQHLGGERRRSASLSWTKTEDDLIHSGVLNSLDSSTTSVGIGGSTRQASGERSIKHASTKQKATKGKRKGKTVGSQGFVQIEIIHPQEVLEHAGSDIMEGIESHGEDEEMEDVEVDIATRTEEEREIVTNFEPADDERCC